MVKNTCLVAAIFLAMTGCQSTSTLPQSSKFIISSNPPGANCYYKGEVRGTQKVYVDRESIKRAEAEIQVKTVILGANYLQLIPSPDSGPFIYAGHAYFCSNLDW